MRGWLDVIFIPISHKRKHTGKLSPGHIYMHLYTYTHIHIYVNMVETEFLYIALAVPKLTP